MHLYDRSVGLFGTNGIVAAGIGHAVGVGMSARAAGARRHRRRLLRRRRGQSWRLPRGAQLRRRAAARRRSSSARTTSTPRRRRSKMRHAQPRDRHQGRRPTAFPASPSTATTCSPSAQAMKEAIERARARRGPDADRGQDLPHRRPSRGRSGHRHLSHAGGARRLGEARSDRHVPQAADRGIRRRRRRRDSPRSRRGSRRSCRRRSTSRGSSPEPDPATVRVHVFAEPLNPPEALRRAPVGETRTHGLARRGARRHRRGDARAIRPSSISAKAPASAAAPSPTPRASGRSSAPSGWSTRRSPSRALPAPRSAPRRPARAPSPT